MMVNFFSGFVTPEGARATQKMFEVARELKKKFPDDEAKYREAYRAWTKANDYPAGTVHDVVDHIDHIVKVAGIDHVGLGSDFDGVPKLPKQLEDVSCYPLITQELLNRGYTKEQIHKILGGNADARLRGRGESKRRDAEREVRIALEIAVSTPDEAVAAERAGADRLELSAVLELGGLTPSLGLFTRVRELVKLPVWVLFRPRAGGFVYSAEEMEVVLRDAELFLAADADGLVFGALDENGCVAEEPCPSHFGISERPRHISSRIRFCSKPTSGPRTTHRAWFRANPDERREADCSRRNRNADGNSSRWPALELP